MKTQSLILITVCIASLCLAGCAAPATQPPASQAPPTQPAVKATPQTILNKETVMNMVDQLNSGDVEGSIANFADDAKVYLIGFPPTGIELYSGKEQIRPFWEDMVKNHFQWEVKPVAAWGDKVDAQVKTWHDFTRQIGVAPLEYKDSYILKDGKIKLYVSWLTEESLGRFKPAFAAAGPPESTPTLSSEPPVSEMTVTFADGTCTTNSPVTLKAGEIKVVSEAKDQENGGYGLQVSTLDPGKDLLDLMVATVSPPTASWDHLLLDTTTQGPGTSETYTFNVEQGPVYLLCWSGPPPMVIGNAGPIPVVP